MAKIGYFETLWTGSHAPLDLNLGIPSPLYRGPMPPAYVYAIKVKFLQPDGGFIAIETMKSIVEGALKATPNAPLPMHLSTLEGLAEWIGSLHNSIIEVDVNEPAELIGAIWRR